MIAPLEIHTPEDVPAIRRCTNLAEVCALSLRRVARMKRELLSRPLSHVVDLSDAQVTRVDRLMAEEDLERLAEAARAGGYEEVRRLAGEQKATIADHHDGGSRAALYAMALDWQEWAERNPVR